MTTLRILVVATVLALSACSPDVAPSPPIATGSASSGPVAVPRQGALFGAWVKPESYSQPGRLDAVSRFETALGRRLDIVNTYRRLHEPIGTESDLHFLGTGSTLMISWAGTSSEDILAGLVDKEIREHAQQIRSLHAPILLRLRWEMDRPNLASSVGTPERYHQAWRYVRQIFAQERATNVSWVFCPTAEGFAAQRAAAYYPGDDTVDWTCVDVYSGSTLRPMAQLLEPFLHWASTRPKPIMIGEYGVARAWPSAKRAAWLTDAAQVFRANPQIKAVLYFESNPEDRTDHGEFALSDDQPALAAFIETAHDPHFHTR
ncbi:hypothetical protein Rhe02_25090 [Rhizocola hellebori]|uniref:GH26 domain-containing protein n=1 Tax=Rhizocola hellebori TaxID=1392758 RepID=A0A8J3Q6T5_9ACTN|nr:glycosyl hydrolase [Rhizocola hellebori]GIH04442.1 hypothetical protein Rhe02_25090 [Rhizocola hellebori]